MNRYRQMKSVQPKMVLRTGVLRSGIVLLLICCALPVMGGELPDGIIALDGRAAHPLKLSDSDGNKINLESLRGHWVLVHFWASWCGPCRKEMPAIQRMATTMKKTSLKLVLVNTAESDDTVFGFLSVAAPELASFMDRDGLVTEQWQPRGLPASFLVDPQGRLRYLALGGREWDTPPYLNFLKELLARPEKSTH